MRILLDTHALLWFVLDAPQLSNSARFAIVQRETDVCVSPASLWELAIKVGLGKYSLPGDFNVFWSDQLAINQFVLLPISLAHTAAVVDLPPVHRDPFDRLLIAQAAVEGIPIISSDEKFDGYDVARIW